MNSRVAVFLAVVAVAFATAIAVSNPGLTEQLTGAGVSSAAVTALDTSEASTAFDNLASQGILSRRQSLQSPMTQGDFVLALQHMFNLPESIGATAFTDVPSNSPLGSALRAVGPYLGRQILCPGCALGTNFVPDQPISNLIAAFITTRVLIGQKKLRLLSPAEADATLATVADARSLPPASRVYFATGVAAGIAPLAPDGRLRAVQDQTVGDAAMLLDRLQRKFAIPNVRQ